MPRRRLWLVLAAAAAVAGCGGQDQAPNASAAPEAAPALQLTRVSAEPVAHGERLARVLGCLGCHGQDLSGEDWSEPDFGRIWTSNLTRAVPAYSDEALANAISGGVRPDGSELWDMPSHLFGGIGQSDMAALIAYLRSRPRTGEVHPRPAFEAGTRREIEEGKYLSSRAQVEAESGRAPPDAGPAHERGRFIVRATCSECHGLDLRGGQPNPKAVPRPDLRMVAGYERADFIRLMRTGRAAGDRELRMMSDVARGRYRHFTDDEIGAVYDYLHAVGMAGQ